MTRWTHSLLLLLPAAVAFIGLVLFIYGDLTGKHWIRLEAPRSVGQPS